MSAQLYSHYSAGCLENLWYTPTDVSLPTYHPSDGSLSWAKLYVTTKTDGHKDPEKGREQDEVMEVPKSSRHKMVRWSIWEDQSMDFESRYIDDS